MSAPYGGPPGWGAPGWNPGWLHQDAPKPGVVPLRPLRVGDILDGAARTIRRYPGPMLGLSAAVMAIVVVGQSVLMYESLRNVSFHWTTGSSGASFDTSGDGALQLFRAGFDVLDLGAITLLAGMLTAAIGPAVLGQPVTGREVFRQARKGFWRLLGASAGVGFMIVLIAACLMIPGAVLYFAGGQSGGTADAGVALLIVGGISALVVGAYVFVALSLAAPVVMLEKRSPIDALRRSRMLVRGDWWRVLGITMLAGLIAGAVQGVISVPLIVIVVAHFASSDAASTGFPLSIVIAFGVTSFVAGVLTQPFRAGVLVLLYVDRRMRVEQLHITLQQVTAAAGAPPPASSADQ